MKNKWLWFYVGGYLLAALGSLWSGWISCVLLLMIAVGSYWYFYQQTGSLINLPGLLGAFWFGGEALACLKLSSLSAPWQWITWLAFFLFYGCYLMGYCLTARKAATGQNASLSDLRGNKGLLKRLFDMILVLTIASFGGFLLEALLLGYVPALVKDTPHAYSYFHVSGVHYFTVSSVMVHPLSVIYVFYSEKGDPRRKWILLLNVLALSVPFLCVSRYFMIMAVALTVLVFLALKGTVTKRTLLILAGISVAFLVPVYLILTVFRSHSVSYLNEIFAMKNPNMPIFVTQPYMYVANNYENFNCLVRDVGADFMFGRRQLFPVLALTGLKFVVPDWLVSTSPVYITKEELTTVTILYDAYYDFGILGVMGFGGILGAACGYLTNRVKQMHNPAAWLFYGQIAMYMILSFFTTWFSNPTTWFWLILTWLVYRYLQGAVETGRKMQA